MRSTRQDGLYRQAADEFGAALGRMARGYEADAEKRRDLLQEMHLSLWRSLAAFDGRCSLRTWVYRVAHNAAASYVIGQRRLRPESLAALEDVAPIAVSPDADRGVALERLMALIHGLRPGDRQIMLAYLDGMEAAEIAELAGISAVNAATKIHRIKKLLQRDYQER